MNIIFDLDGTLIDSKNRVYQVFQFLNPKSKLSFTEYWALKRNGINHKIISERYFNLSDDDYIIFEQNWFLQIENPKWLSLDIPFDGITDYLNRLKNSYTLHIVTARQSEEMVMEQLDKFQWANLFKTVLVTKQKIEKYTLIKKNIHISQSDWIIGDTGKDIQTGKLLKIKSAAVLSGFLNREKLQQYNPDIIVNNVLELKFH